MTDSTAQPSHSALVIQGTKVFFAGKELKGVHAGSARLLKHNGEVRALEDQRGVWWLAGIGSAVKCQFMTEESAHFKLVSDAYARDSKSVYLMAKMGYKIPNSHAPSFEVLADTPYFAKDLHQIYGHDDVAGLRIFHDADMASVRAVAWSAYITDRHNLFHHGDVICTANDQKYLTLLDPSAVYDKRDPDVFFARNKAYLVKKYPSEVSWWHPDYTLDIGLQPLDAAGYHLTPQAVYLLEPVRHLKKSVPTVVTYADPATFTALNACYGKDSATAFCGALRMHGVDLDSFEVVRDLLARDCNAYYFDGRVVDCDYASFEIMNAEDHRFAAKDAHSLYFAKRALLGQVGVRTGEGWVLQAAQHSDPATFVRYSDAWAKDKQQVYQHAGVLAKADAPSFEHLFTDGHNDWAKDCNALYNANGARIVKGVDGASFRMLNQFWGVDATSVFCFATERVLPSADRSSFMVLGNKGEAQDINFNYAIAQGVVKKKVRRTVLRSTGRFIGRSQSS